MSSVVKSKFKIITHEKPILSSQFQFKRIFNGPQAGKIFYYWSPRNDDELKADFSAYNNFSITEPIEHSARSDYSKEFYSAHYDDSFSLIFQSSENTGYIRPFYSFIKNEFNPAVDSIKSYSETLALFNLSHENTIKPHKLNEMCSYRDNLVVQLYRQAESIYQINNLLISVLKFLVYQIDRQQSRPAIKNSINRLFYYDILGGVKRGAINLEFLDAACKDEEPIKHAITSSKTGFDYLLSFRDPTLETAVKLVKILYPLEIVIEKAIIGETIFTPKEYRVMSMPTSYDVANNMITKAKNTKYSAQTIGNVMDHVKNYLIDNDIHSLIGDVDSLATVIKNEVLLAEDEKKASMNTVRNWISTYAHAAGIPYSRKEESEKN